MDLVGSTFALVATLVLTAGAGGHAVAQQTRSGAELLAAAEQSFSSVPFGVRPTPPGLVRIEDEACLKWGECAYRDANQVRHYFGDCCDIDALVVKSVEVANVGDRPIGALGIGDARSMPDVVERVRRFLPEAEVDCRDDLDDVAPYTCGAKLGEGWIQLFFDSSQRLLEVRIDAYHFT